MNKYKKSINLTYILVVSSILAGCSYLPTSGFGRKEIENRAEQPNMQGIQVIDINDDVAKKLYKKQSTQLFSEVFGSDNTNGLKIGSGDTVVISIWEAPPASLFNSMLDVRVGSAPNSVTTLPEQTVDSSGNISVPFVGAVRAEGRTLTEIEKDITKKLKGKANQPQVMAKLMHNQTSNVTVVGEFANSLRMPLTPKGERLLDAIAAAGGTVKQPVNKMTIQLTRDNKVVSLPFDKIISDPKQNISLKAGDVVTALYQTFSFTALGATGKNEEINFEAQGISLAQALGRVGGLQDSRSDAQGIFLFRFEDANAMDWPQKPVAKTADGKVPVIYRVNLKDPSSFFVAQTFQVDNKDILYISNAPITEMQKFLNVLFSITYPITSITNTLQN
ncbi:MAG: polysaccharide biosynthesis/export family protein [Methylophilus sp.]